ncbi:proline dehydrogenase family protein [Parapedobacter sp. ISTM3]|uniref:L-proline dehydrogenase n=1 Tax=Parapedobacter luteus TaxID=623280 RepID=A0A1T5E3N7_9SPHI|nr:MULTISPECIES: proline dehydrogenase family protein [Parapedobacter]MBK1441049.1 proline dehydrogenase family protein [Parapedobacter sp. ISTM3]SKB78383.1 L-proline dehydrogenase [Parapedobacter luteus]
MSQQTQQQSALSFENTEIAFKSKSNADLNKAYWLFKIIASNFLTNVGPPITNFALRAGLPVTGLIRSTIFNHFCGGETITGCIPAIERLASQRVGTILDYSVEGEDTEQVFDETCDEILRTVAYAKTNPNIAFSVFKPTGLGRFELFEKVDAKQPLTPEETAEYERVKQRIERICQACFDEGVKVLIDAEHSWIQDAIDDLAREMMQRYNRNAPVVYNTYQLYRHDKLASLQADCYLAETDGFFLGAKLVRGAYMEIERERAAEQGYLSPIQPDKASTDRDYNLALLFCLDHIDRVGFMAGTHNEDSSRLLAQEMDRRQLAHNHPHIHFAQLLGMSDNLSFNLAEVGYNVAKYMPYGPVKAVMPYLFRRAQENTSVAGQTGRELALITKEKRRRKSSK